MTGLPFPLPRIFTLTARKLSQTLVHDFFERILILARYFLHYRVFPAEIFAVGTFEPIDKFVINVDSQPVIKLSSNIINCSFVFNCRI